MKNFYNFLEQADEVASQPPKRVSDDIVTVFGRHNPPHLGHGLTLDAANKIAGNIGDKAQADQRFYTSRSFDPKKNPLPFRLKTEFLKQMFPKHAQKWDGDESVRTLLGAATKASDQGYKNFHFVGGGDRKQGMEDLLRRYNGNLYNFDNIYSHSAGERLADEADKLKETDTSEMSDKDKEELKKKIFLAKLSASKMRGFAGKGDFESFAQGLPIAKKGFTMDDAKRLFNAVQMFSQGAREDVDVRHLYRTNQIFLEGEVVESDETGLVGSIHRRGANHLICVTENDVMFKCFLDEVSYVG